MAYKITQTKAIPLVSYRARKALKDADTSPPPKKNENKEKRNKNMQQQTSDCS